MHLSCAQLERSWFRKGPGSWGLRTPPTVVFQLPSAAGDSARIPLQHSNLSCWHRKVWPPLATRRTSIRWSSRRPPDPRIWQTRSTGPGRASCPLTVRAVSSVFPGRTSTSAWTGRACEMVARTRRSWRRGIEKGTPKRAVRFRPSQMRRAGDRGVGGSFAGGVGVSKVDRRESGYHRLDQGDACPVRGLVLGRMMRYRAVLSSSSHNVRPPASSTG